MIQLNLLPDVKLEFVKTQQVKNRVVSISIIASVVALAFLAFMLVTVNYLQKQSIKNLDKDVSKYSTQLKGIDDLSNILTIQNQLNTISGLHDDKAVATRLFGFINQLTPSQASLSQINVDFVNHTIVFSGEAPSLDVVNLYTDTLKATTFDSNGDTKKAFSGVVLASFGRDSSKVSYTINFSFDELIFDSAQDVSLKVPAGPTVDPATVFQKQGDTTNGS